MCFSNIFEVIIMAVSNMRATLLYPIEVVWDTVTNLNDFSWRSDLKDVRIIDEIENKNIKGTWVGKFYVEDDKTILDFTENVVSKKLIFKPFISLYLKRQQRIYFKDLKVKLNCKEASFI